VDEVPHYPDNCLNDHYLPPLVAFTLALIVFSIIPHPRQKSHGFGAWVLVGELLGEAVDVLRREGLERDGCLSLFHGVDCTSIPPIFEHPQGLVRVFEKWLLLRGF
jgi:hypothetical protein